MRHYISSPLKAEPERRFAKDKANTSAQKTKQTFPRAAPSPVVAELPSPGGTEARPAEAATGTTKPRWRPRATKVRLHLPARSAARARDNGARTHGSAGQDYNSRGAPRRGGVRVDGGAERPPHIKWRRWRERAERVLGRRTRARPSSPHCPGVVALAAGGVCGAAARGSRGCEPGCRPVGGRGGRR